MTLYLKCYVKTLLKTDLEVMNYKSSHFKVFPRQLVTQKKLA